jgi:hypothetical protein
MAVTAIIPLVSVGWRRPIIDMASTSGGIDRNTSVIRISPYSIQPPMYPAMRPMVTPTGAAIASTTMLRMSDRR